MATASVPRFMVLGKSKYVHVVRSKREDLRSASGDGAQCQQVRKYQVAGKVKPKDKGLSREAASALAPCPNCGTAAVLKSMVTPEERRAAAKAKSDETRDKIKDSTKTKAQRKKGTKAPKATKSKKGGGGKRSSGDSTKEKAEALVAFAQEHGWGAELVDADPGIAVVAIRGDETIRCTFVDGKYDAGRHAYLEVGSWTGKLRGVHGCRKQMAGEGRDRPHANPGAGRSVSRKKSVEDDVIPEDESPEDAKRRVPFLMDDDDVVILDAILGKTIRWRNGVSGSIEEAWLPAKAKGEKKPKGGFKRDKVAIVEHPKTGKRMLNFLSVLSVDENGEHYGPERSVYLDKIVRVQ